MKKLLLLSAIFISGLLSAQTPNMPFSENFDSTTPGSIPAGWTTGKFTVMANHGVSNTQAISTEIQASHTSDTLTTPLIGPLTATSVISLQYRIAENVAGIYPQQAATLVSGDQIVVQANSPQLPFGWITATTISTTSNPALVSSLSFTTYSYSVSSILFNLAGDYVQLRIIVDRGSSSTGDWFLDIDNVNVGAAPTGIKYNASNAPALSIFPNPSNGDFTVWLKNYQSNNQVEVNIYNLLGQKIKTVAPGNAVNKQISISSLGLERGMYIIEVKSGSEVANSKIQID